MNCQKQSKHVGYLNGPFQSLLHQRKALNNNSEEEHNLEAQMCEVMIRATRQVGKSVIDR